jgi:hypothetical protein
VTVDDLLDDIIEAHGGRTLWNSIKSMESVISARGLLFTVKRRPVLDHLRVTAHAHEPHFVFQDYPSPGSTGELIGNREVRITGPEGRVVWKRLNPRQAFKGLRRIVYWDALDFVYFGGYALWNYFTIPFLFLRGGFRFEALDTPGDGPPSWTKLVVTFPDDIPTHCRSQTFYVDEHRHIRRLDYTAEVVGHWVRAAHVCELYREFDGLRAPTRRRVLPMPWGNMPLPGPVLVAIDIHDIRLIRNG